MSDVIFDSHETRKNCGFMVLWFYRTLGTSKSRVVNVLSTESLEKLRSITSASCSSRFL